MLLRKKLAEERVMANELSNWLLYGGLAVTSAGTAAIVGGFLGGFTSALAGFGALGVLAGSVMKLAGK